MALFAEEWLHAVSRITSISMYFFLWTIRTKKRGTSIHRLNNSFVPPQKNSFCFKKTTRPQCADISVLFRPFIVVSEQNKFQLQSKRAIAMREKSSGGVAHRVHVGNRMVVFGMTYLLSSMVVSLVGKSFSDSRIESNAGWTDLKTPSATLKIWRKPMTRSYIPSCKNCHYERNSLPTLW